MGVVVASVVATVAAIVAVATVCTSDGGEPVSGDGANAAMAVLTYHVSRLMTSTTAARSDEPIMQYS